MALFSMLLLEIVALVGTVILIGFLVLLFRNPYRGYWLRTETAETAAALIAVAGPVFMFAAFTSGLSRAGIGLVGALSILVTITAVTAFVAARLFRFRERLARAAAGQNPFDSMDVRIEKQGAPLIE